MLLKSSYDYENNVSYSPGEWQTVASVAAIKQKQHVRVEVQAIRNILHLRVTRATIECIKVPNSTQLIIIRVMAKQKSYRINFVRYPLSKVLFFQGLDSLSN